MFGPCGRRRELLIEPGSLRKQTPWKARTRQDNVFSLSAEGDREILIAGHTPNTLVNDLINCQDVGVCISQDHVFFSFVFFRRPMQCRPAVGNELPMCECMRPPRVLNSRFHGVAFLLFFLPPPRRRGLLSGALRC